MGVSVLLVSAFFFLFFISREFFKNVLTQLFMNTPAPGTVFDDISKRGCINQSECLCKHDRVYASGEIYQQDREEWYVKCYVL